MLAALAFATCTGVMSLSTSARANGRYPLADQIVVDPVHPEHLLARATFGLLESEDGGKSFHWVCETAIGYFGVEDPPIAITANGSAIVASSKGLSVSADRGCSWRKNSGLTGTWYGVDVTVQPSRPHEALAVLSHFVDGAYTVAVARTTNDGAEWSEVISSFGSSFVATTVEVAPSNPDRIYVSGKVLPSGAAAMMRSDDGGRTWTHFPLALQGAFSIFIGAVDPQDPDRVYVRTHADGVGRVLVSTDGAATWRDIWEVPDDVAGFALSADGTTLAVGGSAVGVSIASTSDFAFRKTSNVGVYCLTFSGEKLLVCTKEAIDGFSIGVSADLGEHFDPLLHLSDVLPRACEAAQSSTAICAMDWGEVARTIGADAGSSSPADAGDAGDGAPTPAQSCSCSFTSRVGTPEGATYFMALACFFARSRRPTGRTRFSRVRLVRSADQ